MPYTVQSGEAVCHACGACALLPHMDMTNAWIGQECMHQLFNIGHVMHRALRWACNVLQLLCKASMPRLVSFNAAQSLACLSVTARVCCTHIHTQHSRGSCVCIPDNFRFIDFLTRPASLLWAHLCDQMCTL